ncbi:FAD-dependent oxidoreductase [Paraburkholderia sp. J41]|uniref:FAD-dependent oxidoreductase n=1 Tax=Paraburkholderia sp. J41 TaxID=2805433 RepID=UPI002AC36500|nr:2Fe-2S iron-sulfur cluster-binding protein [Paraburkholderia sp. J41]
METSESVPIEFEGEVLQARRGETLAAALVAHGIQRFRTTPREQPRGMFCGMGVCQDCLVEVDGVPNQRACMTKISRPLSVRMGSQRAPIAIHAQARDVHGEQASCARESAPVIEVRRPQVLVIGAGPGGIAAALEAARAGASVTVLDERSLPGGQYFKQPGVATGAPGVPGPDAQHARGARLIAEARSAGVQIVNDALVWGAFAPREFVAVEKGRSVRYLPEIAVVATGAYERGWQVPGWTLPGVMTTGAAQTLWRTSRRVPGKRVLIAGNGPLNLQLAAELTEGGAQVLAVVEAARAPAARDWRTLLDMGRCAPDLIAEGLRYRRIARAGGARLLYGQWLDAVTAGPEGLVATLAGGANDALDGHKERQEHKERFVADAVCLGYGFEPANELLRALGCAHEYDAARRQLVTQCDAHGLTSMPGVYALGDCTGLGGARAALAQGALTGMAVAAALGYGVSARAKAEAARALGKARQFQAALWTLYASPLARPEAPCGDTLICRCEEVSFATLQAALDEGLTTVGAIKRRTRIGMGRCQGRYCAPVLDEIVSARAGRERDELSGFAPRVPVKPVTIAELAGVPPT